MLTISEIQDHLYIMLKEFDSFCKENDIKYSLSGGWLLGAIRHNGFIPWDDDLDFFMPRKDYEKLAELWPRYADERYFLSKSNKDFVDRNLFITIRDKETTYIKPYQQDYKSHLLLCPWKQYPANNITTINSLLNEKSKQGGKFDQTSQRF